MGKAAIRTSQTTSKTKYTLILLLFYEPWCQASQQMIHKLEKVYNKIISQKEQLRVMLSSSIYYNSYNDNDDDVDEYLSLPLIGKMDTSTLDNDDIVEFYSLFDNMDHVVPAMKFVFVEHHRHDVVNQTIIDYVGDSNSIDGIVDTIMHYWYRFVVSNYISDQSLNQVSNQKYTQPIRPIFTFSDMDTLTSFVEAYKHSYLFKITKQDLTSASEREEAYIRHLLEDENDDKDVSFIGFVQCRKRKLAQDLYQQFDDLAKTYVHRRDVAFFVVISDNCEWLQHQDNADSESSLHLDDNDGYLRVLKIYSSPLSNHLTIKCSFGNVYPSQHTKLTMFQFAVVELTPLVLWFDRLSSTSLSFPIYRKIHLCLFIDMHTPRLKDGSFDYSSLAFKTSKYAISQLKETARRHKQIRSEIDLVSLIIPSTETEVLMTFGIDIWSNLDRSCIEGDLEECYPDHMPLLPMTIITSRVETPTSTLRYNLSSEKMISSDLSNNTINEFLTDYFDGKLMYEIKSESASEHSTLESGVKIVTGNTFNELVMRENKKHSLVQFYAPYCGHCKRFNVIFNELATIIHDFHWDSIIDVMMIDITKNDIMHSEVNIHEVPTVYLFPKDQKDSPIEMIITEGSNSNVGGIKDVDTILEWIIESNVIENEVLYTQIQL